MQPRHWLRLFLRAGLAIPMIGSGVGRLIPVRMPPPQPFDFVRRLGELTPMELIWTLVGAAPVFQSATGLAALIGGVLLLFPRTTLLGALICAANLLMAISVSVCYDMPFTPYLSFLLLLSLLLIAPDARRLIHLFLLDRPVELAAEERAVSCWRAPLFIFLLNMCYDVPVKLPSLHLLVMSILLIAPSLRRLADVFLFNRRSEPMRAIPHRAGHVLVAARSCAGCP